MDIQFGIPTNFGLGADESVQDLEVDSLVPAAGQEHVFQVPGVSPACAGDCGCGGCDGGSDPYFPPTRCDVTPLPGGCYFFVDPPPPDDGDPPDPPKDPVQQICGPDVTASLLELMNNLASQVQSIPTIPPLSLQIMFRKRGPLDFKAKTASSGGASGGGGSGCPVNCPDTVMICGHCLDSSVVGNLVFGAMLSANKNLKRTALAASEQAEKGFWAGVDVFIFGSDHANENPADQKSVDTGWELHDEADSKEDADSGDNPITEEELCKKISGGGFQGPTTSDGCEPCPSGAPPFRYKVPKLIERTEYVYTNRGHVIYYHPYAMEGE